MGVIQLPRGARLSEESLHDRHVVLTRVLWAHVVVLSVWALVNALVRHPAQTAMSGGGSMAGMGGEHGVHLPGWLTVALPLVPCLFAVVAARSSSMRASTQATSLGLISTSFVAIELSGGSPHAHIHLYAILVFVALYQAWSSLLSAIIAVAIHHAVVGVLAPEFVFGMSMSARAALATAGVHAGLLVLEVGAILAFWGFAEKAESQAQVAARAAEEQRLGFERERASTLEADSVRARRQADHLTGLAQRAAREVAEAHEGARAAAAAVAGIEAQLTALTDAVRDISTRTQAAAQTAQQGQSAAQAAASQMGDLEHAIDEIADVNQLIAQIAGQTNLLALNATIEAARAGSAGLGFGVVAAEVKQMANDTATSAERVEGIVSTAVSGAGAVLSSFSQTTAVVGEMLDLQVDIAASVEEQTVTLIGINTSLGAVSAASSAIALSLERLSVAVSAITS